mmetsp:Transcript_12913/g.51559  ORF Transcript_12913/g.51559 Transcript_12913/m.51559 type:complete len:196 (-) Transcript_12913:1519-2106(-)
MDDDSGFEPIAKGLNALRVRLEELDKASKLDSVGVELTLTCFETLSPETGDIRRVLAPAVSPGGQFTGSQANFGPWRPNVGLHNIGQSIQPTQYPHTSFFHLAPLVNYPKLLNGQFFICEGQVSLQHLSRPAVKRVEPVTLERARPLLRGKQDVGPAAQMLSKMHNEDVYVAKFTAREFMNRISSNSAVKSAVDT